MLNEDELRDVLLLIFANKQDLPNAMKPLEITDKLFRVHSGAYLLSFDRGASRADDGLAHLGCMCHEWRRSL
ncbi:hypothetical protein EDB84DRAFT_1517095 [Lactarius hengduanensis]|nr:hypothetical protein EDB84DRAFT_1517095 [Lactarius hengduanensis]